MTENRNGLRINQDRLWNSLQEMARIGAGLSGGSNRQALTDDDRAGRDLFCSWVRDTGCEISIDAIGNIFARRSGFDETAEPVLAGSHLDTQATGGIFDGVYGVLAGLEAIRVMQDHNITTRRSIDIVVWTNEEGCRFAPAMLGSGVVSGAYSLDFAYDRVDRNGLRLGDELKRIGYLGSSSIDARRYAAAFEAHIEQGPILENEGVTIGCVTGIQGAYWLDVTLEGASCHAGPTPMSMRRDPWRAAIPIVSGALQLAEVNGESARATIGNVQTSPGARNTVPERITLSIDLRHPDAATLEKMVAELKDMVALVCEHQRITHSIEHIWHMAPTVFDDRLIALVEETARNLGYSRKRMVSGAGHDSLHTARYAPTAMIFIPCAGGISHNESECATASDLAAGANVLMHALLEAANR